MSVASIIDGVIGNEGRFSNNPNDPGGPTMWGITEKEARANGYQGPMNVMPRATAQRIYLTKYVQRPGFDAVIPLSEVIATELVDTGVNMGPAIATIMLQRSLNALNGQGKFYADINVDGDCGSGTVSALKAYLAKRGTLGEHVMLEALNCLQGDRYIEIAEKRPASEDFVFGWLANRIAL